MTEKDDDDAPDEGGYWLGTENELQNTHILQSSRRKSIIEIQNVHGEQVREMQKRFPNHDLHNLIKFLKARDYNVQKASDMYKAHLEWRESYLPSISEQKAKETLATKKFYLLESPDKLGHAVIFYCFHRFMEMEYVVEDEVEALVYMLEHQVIPRFGPSFETQQFSVLIDISGIRSPPLSFLQKMNTVMEANYPESLFRITMFPVPYWLQK